MKRFNIRQWRASSVLGRLLILATCRHRHNTELRAFQYLHQGDDPDPPCHFEAGAMATQVIVLECCRCGHIHANHTYTMIDRTPGAFRALMDRHFERLGGQAKQE